MIVCHLDFVSGERRGLSASCSHKVVKGMPELGVVNWAVLSRSRRFLGLLVESEIEFSLNKNLISLGLGREMDSVETECFLSLQMINIGV